MSWQLAAFAILAVGLIAGFAWYERTRPDARIVALVGTLAAFAALGRIAFAAVPNVKPTTVIVLISGYALGGAPGYVVGAVAALTSNFFFGQGPWTPWQMAGWGATGIAGAGLAWITRGRIGRLPLALVCFAAGFAFTALQDFGDWVTYSDHSLVQLGVFVGKGIGFDLVYAVSSFGFAMLFGPALIRTLNRFRTRIQVEWLAPATSSAVMLAVVSVAIGSLAAARTASASTARTASASTAVSPFTYLLKAQNKDGGFGMTRGQSSDLMVTGWATLALFAGAELPRGHAAFIKAERYLARTVAKEKGAGAIERTVLAAEVLYPRPKGLSLTDFGGRNLLAALRHLVQPNGSVAGQTNLTSFWVIGARLAGLQISQRTIGWIARQQDRDGGFNWLTAGGQSDIDDTGAALQALAGSNESRTISRAVRFIREHQNRDGGFGMGPGESSNAQSTAFAIAGLSACSVFPEVVKRDGSPTPVAYLRSLIQHDGAVDYARGDSQSPVWVTAQAWLGLNDEIF